MVLRCSLITTFPLWQIWVGNSENCVFDGVVQLLGVLFAMVVHLLGVIFVFPLFVKRTGFDPTTFEGLMEVEWR
jgi:hypothetical protein